MPRARNIKPDFFKNEQLVELPFETRLLFAGLWTLAGKDGRLEDRPKKIKMEIFPGDDVDVSHELSRLAEAGLVQRYTASGVHCIQIMTFTKHQNPHPREPESGLPAPPPKNAQSPDNKAAMNCNLQDSGEQVSGPAESFSLNPDPGIPLSTCASGDAPASDLSSAPEHESDAPPDDQPEVDGGSTGSEQPPESDTLYTAEFERFWSVYPNSKGKKPAAKAFRTLRRSRPGAEFLEFLIEDVSCRARGTEWTKEGGKFVPMASTYLNQERWNDPPPNVEAISAKHTGFESHDYSEGLIEGVDDDAANF